MINFNLTSIVNLVGFIFFVLILYKLLYKPFLDVVAKRKEIISKSLSDAEKAKLDSEKIKEDMEKEI
ncbi:MAG TPA: ATP synthase F0 subunit B, partial [Petrotogaceae bacterium]|nr:ATP synthase F0 subunit B [Petrotogaceae bacterium]HNY37688.1 ATP synthase F0 subunit B [Petrotogaceae bacterium]